MNSAMTLCGQKERRPHFSGAGNRPEATPANHVDSETPIKDKTSGRESKISGVIEVPLGLVFIVRLRNNLEASIET